MNTWRLVDVGVFFNFFLLLFVRPLFFFVFGGLGVFFLPNSPIVSTIRSGQLFSDLVWAFFLESF